jgi:hypothetical protein
MTRMFEQFIIFLIIQIILYIYRHFDEYTAPIERRLSKWLDDRELSRLERSILNRRGHGSID